MKDKRGAKDKIVRLEARRNPQAPELKPLISLENSQGVPQDEEDGDLLALMARNAHLAKRRAEERAKANRVVLRQYKIKN